MLLSALDYDLPEDLIAQYPAEQRDGSRMLLLNRREQTWADHHFTALPTFFKKGDVVVVNDTRVFAARLVGKRVESGGRVELFLVRELEPGIWETLAKPGRRLSEGSQMSFGDGKLLAQVIRRTSGGRAIVRFEPRESSKTGGSNEELRSLLDRIGQTPLPPYIKRSAGNLHADRERYQTVYARSRGAIAAPTAGLHFTQNVLDQIVARGASVTGITLHVGYGTFEPVRVEDPEEHHVASEWYEVSDSAVRVINNARIKRDARIVAIGTTTTRALESAMREEELSASAGWATLTIRPGYKFRIVNALLTNFHLPRSSLLLLVSAFGGQDLVMAAYRHAVDARYRFYSYGDCMLII